MTEQQFKEQIELLVKNHKLDSDQWLEITKMSSVFACASEEEKSQDQWWDLNYIVAAEKERNSNESIENDIKKLKEELILENKSKAKLHIIYKNGKEIVIPITVSVGLRFIGDFQKSDWRDRINIPALNGFHCIVVYEVGSVLLYYDDPDKVLNLVLPNP